MYVCMYLLLLLCIDNGLACESISLSSFACMHDSIQYGRGTSTLLVDRRRRLAAHCSRCDVTTNPQPMFRPLVLDHLLEQQSSSSSSSVVVADLSDETVCATREDGTIQWRPAVATQPDDAAPSRDVVVGVGVTVVAAVAAVAIKRKWIPFRQYNGCVET